MKVCKFLINVSQSGSANGIVGTIPNIYRGEKNIEEYKKFCQVQFSKLGPHTQHAFGAKGIIAWRCIDGFDYYIRKHVENDESIKKICLEVLLIMESKALTNAVENAFDDIRSELKQNGLQVDFSENKVDVYLVENRDLLEKHYFVKALFYKEQDNIQDVVRKKICLWMGVVLVILILVAIVIDSNSEKDLLWLTTALVGLLIAVPITYFLEWIMLKSSLKSAVIVNDFDQEWFSLDSAAESTVQAAANGGTPYKSPAMPGQNGGAQ